MRNKLFKVLESVIKDLNDELEYDSLRNIQNETPIFSGEFSIDSISLAILIGDFEMSIREQLGLKVILADEKAMSRKNSPYKTVGTLLDFTLERLEGGNA